MNRSKEVIEVLSGLFVEQTGVVADSVKRLTPAGSDRMYYRLEGRQNNGANLSLIGVYGTSLHENEAFFSISRQLRSLGLPVPELLCVSADGMFYLQQDLGDAVLFDIMQTTRTEHGFSDETVGLLESVMTLLPEIQVKGAQGLDFSKCHPSAEFDRRGIMWDLNYFKYCFLKIAVLEIDEVQLENEFERMADNLLKETKGNTFMYRDFQSRNVMIKEGRPWFIDYQGGRKGPLQYDVVSFLWQARAAIPANLRNHLVDVYLDSLSTLMYVDKEAFRNSLPLFVLFRTLQVLGAYGFRGFTENKAHFLQSIPAAMNNVRELLEWGIDDYPHISQLLKEILVSDKCRFRASDSHGKLTVRVASFSYKKGLPRDFSGNGGGFVFDCRFMNNPGRYEEYKQLTGLDGPVQKFLETQSEMPEFLERVYSIVEPAVKSYSERGFTDLMISFGCTGGQHRSAYSAEHAAKHIKERFGDSVRVILTHRELKMEREL